MSYYCHTTPGRLRVKTPIIKQNPVEIEKVRAMLQALPGVDGVSINALTGSITINYSGWATDCESILSILKKRPPAVGTASRVGGRAVKNIMWAGAGCAA